MTYIATNIRFFMQDYCLYNNVHLKKRVNAISLPATEIEVASLIDKKLCCFKLIKNRFLMMKFLISNPSNLTNENFQKQKFANGKMILPPEVTNAVDLSEVPLLPAEQISDDICKCLLLIQVTKKQMKAEMLVPTYGNQMTYIPTSLSPYNDLQFVFTSKDNGSLNSDESSKIKNNQVPPVKQKSNPVSLTSS